MYSPFAQADTSHPFRLGRGEGGREVGKEGGRRRLDEGGNLRGEEEGGGMGGGEGGGVTCRSTASMNSKSLMASPTAWWGCARLWGEKGRELVRERGTRNGATEKNQGRGGRKEGRKKR